MNIVASLRSFVPEDADRVIELLQDVSTYKPDPAKTPALVRHFTEQVDTHACVAITGDRVVGFGSIFMFQRVRGGMSAIIEDIVVENRLRGCGIGRLILNDLLAEARKRECFKISLECGPAAEQFYKATGFEMGGRVMKYLL